MPNDNGLMGAPPDVIAYYERYGSLAALRALKRFIQSGKAVTIKHVEDEIDARITELQEVESNEPR